MGRKRKPRKPTQKPEWLNVLERQEHPRITVLVDREENETELPEWSNDEQRNQFWAEIDSNFKYHLNNLFPLDNGSLCDRRHDDEESRRKELDANAQQYLSSLADVILKELQESPEPNLTNHMVLMVTVLEGLLANSSINARVKIHILDLFAVWCDKQLIMNESIWMSSLFYLLKKSLEPNALKADVKRVFQFRDALRFFLQQGEKPDPAVVKLLLELPKKHIYLDTTEGRSFIALSMSLDTEFTVEIHEVIRAALATCKTPESQSYGAIYCQAWQISSNAVRDVIERKFKNYMHCFFTFQRKGLALSVIGSNVFQIARAFHSQRNNLPMKKMLSNTYGTLLWMFLDEGSNNTRCNAVQVLFDAYPMEKPGAGREENSIYIEEQHRRMTLCLTDQCHLIRIIAVRQMCTIMAEYWLAIPREILKDWIKIIVEQLAIDSSDVEVRRSVYRSIPKLFNNVNAENYLCDVLPRLKNNFHDINQDVRIAFTDMLIAAKNAPTLKFWDIVPMEDILARLEIESHNVGSKLVDLIYDSFIAEHFTNDIIYRRLAQLIVMNRNAVRKFFLFSECRLSAADALELMLGLLTHVYLYVERMLKPKKRSVDVPQNVLQETSETQKDKKTRKRRLYCGGKENVHLASSGHEDSEDGTTPVEENENEAIYTSLDPSNPHVSQGFIDIISVIWTLHGNTYLLPEFAEKQQKINELCAICVPRLLRYYKQDCSIFGSVLYLASLMPRPILKRVSTVEGMLLSQIKKLTLSDAQSELTMRIQPLCMWGRAGDVLEIAQEWMNEAFRIEDLNASFAENGARRKKKVNFEKALEVKPRMGLRLLASVLDQPVCKAKVLAKNYDQVKDFWLFMSKIKTLVSTRMTAGEPFDHPLLSDEFLQECFMQYILLIPTLDVEDSTEKKIDTITEFKFIFNWATETLIPAVPKEVPSDPHRSSNVGVSPFAQEPLPIVMLRDILDVASNIVSIDLANAWFGCDAGRFCLNLLKTGCKMMFVSAITNFLSILVVHVKRADRKDSANLFRSVTLTVVIRILEAFAEVRFDVNTVQRLLQNFTKVKGFLASVISSCKIFGKPTSNFFKRLARSFVVNIVKILMHEIVTAQVVEALKKIQDLPYLASHLMIMVKADEIFGNVFLEQMENYFKEGKFNEEPTTLLSAFSFLHLLVHAPGKFKKRDLVAVLERAQEAFNKYVEHVKKLDTTLEIIDPPNTTATLNIMDELKTLKKAIRLALLGNDALELWEVDELVRQQSD